MTTKSLRPVAALLLGGAVLLTTTGCRTAGVRDLTRPEVFAPRAGATASELLRETNRNAQRVLSVEAKPAITVNRQGTVNGKLALERPRNFKLILATAMSDVADIGSNEQEFWFWIKDSQEKAVYFCNYDESGRSPLSSSLQPDWIVETLGLRVIPEAELAMMTVRPGPEPSTLLLTSPAKPVEGRPYLKEIVLSETTRRIREHRVYTPDRKTLLARAVVGEYQEPNGQGDGMSRIFLPRKLRLEWNQIEGTRDRLTLDIVLNGVKLNPPFDDNRRQALFVEPSIRGFARVNLAERAGVAASPAAPPPENRTTVRQSLPAPPPRVRLAEPSPLGRRGPDAVERVSAITELPPLPPRGIEEVVGPQIPTVTDPPHAYVQANPGWKGRVSAPVER